MIDTIKHLRRTLHTYPELSGNEANTALRITEFITKHHPTKIIENIAGYGIAAIYSFGDGGPTIAIRCELDALPIDEKNHFDHKSKHKGISHKCGHDGHMSIVAGLVFWLKEQSFAYGTVVLLFQPAEETGKGAFPMIADPRINELKIEYVFALHNIPYQPMHSVITINSGFSAEVQSFYVKLTGRECHASEPENGINPTEAIGKIIAQLTGHNVHNRDDSNFAILTPVYLSMGQKSYGISPAKGEIHYTIRTWTPERMSMLKTKIQQTISSICREHHLKQEIKWFEYFPATINNTECTEIVKSAAKTNGFQIIESPYPFKFGEDFGWFSRKYKVAMFGLGAGKQTPVLHDSFYDFPDEILESGIKMFQSIIYKILSHY